MAEYESKFSGTQIDAAIDWATKNKSVNPTTINSRVTSEIARAKLAENAINQTLNQVKAKVDQFPTTSKVYVEVSQSESDVTVKVSNASGETEQDTLPVHGYTSDNGPALLSNADYESLSSMLPLKSALHFPIHVEVRGKDLYVCGNVTKLLDNGYTPILLRKCRTSHKTGRGSDRAKTDCKKGWRMIGNGFTIRVNRSGLVTKIVMANKNLFRVKAYGTNTYVSTASNFVEVSAKDANCITWGERMVRHIDKTLKMPFAIVFVKNYQYNGYDSIFWQNAVTNIASFHVSHCYNGTLEAYEWAFTR